MLDESTRRKRLDLARTGVAMVTVLVDQKRRLLEAPQVTTRGIPTVDEDRVALRRVAMAVSEAMARAVDHRMEGVDVVVERAARRELFELSGIRPLVDVHVLER